MLFILHSVLHWFSIFFFFNDTATTEIYTLHIVGSVRCVQETGFNTSLSYFPATAVVATGVTAVSVDVATAAVVVSVDTAETSSVATGAATSSFLQPNANKDKHTNTNNTFFTLLISFFQNYFYFFQKLYLFIFFHLYIFTQQ
eukprot:TRINITY_DN25266_c0_g1_i1.p2 TRINITY_DN25266_c0_g1~~TRINITY_DN25266_c0_g1_i1.p2  ORF type:complete len:143 (+),score=31.66 TRINITY_DN25266_c0_g1_i1:74-502(+)